MLNNIDILIIHAEKDNETLEKSQGWVSSISKFLKMMLAQISGKIPQVFLMSTYDHSTTERINKSTIVISVLSQHFIQSEECRSMVTSLNNVKVASTHNKLFKILKEPILIENQPLQLRRLTAYNMYLFNSETDEVESNIDVFTEREKRMFWMKMVDLVYDIYDCLAPGKRNTATSGGNLLTTPGFIYLAHTSHELDSQRNIIRRELQRYGHTVLPNRTYSMHLKELREEITQDLEKCSLSIHLIGHFYGDTPSDSDRSYLDIQNELAAQKSAADKDNDKFLRLIWVSNELDNAKKGQLSFIERIKRNISSSENTEILQTTFEDFKNVVKEEVAQRTIDKIRKASTLTTEKSNPNVYILYDKLDHEAIVPIHQELERIGFNVLLPSFEGELLDLRQRHINNLRQFDTAIIFQEKVNDQWVKMKLLDLLKAPGLGRSKAIKGKAIVSMTEKNPNINGYKDHNIELIHARNGDLIGSVKGFLKEVYSWVDE